MAKCYYCEKEFIFNDSIVETEEGNLFHDNWLESCFYEYCYEDLVIRSFDFDAK